MKEMVELPWRCSDEIKAYLVMEALVSPPDPMAFYLMAKETVISSFRYCYGEEFEDGDHLWESFKEFSDGNWAPPKIFEWLELMGQKSRPQFDPSSKLERPR